MKKGFLFIAITGLFINFGIAENIQNPNNVQKKNYTNIKKKTNIVNNNTKQVNYQELLKELKEIKKAMNANGSKENKTDKLSKEINYLNLKITYLETLQKVKDIKSKTAYIRITKQINNDLIKLMRNKIYYLTYYGKINMGGKVLYEVSKSNYNFIISNVFILKDYINRLKTENKRLNVLSYDDIKNTALNKINRLDVIGSTMYSITMNKNISFSNKTKTDVKDYIYIEKKDLPFKYITEKNNILYLKGI